MSSFFYVFLTRVEIIRMLSEEEIILAITNGENQAASVVDFRNQELKKRSLAINQKSPQIATLDIQKIDIELAEALGPESRDLLVAEGDSWFDYPFHDILRFLEDEHGYDIESVAQKGDRVEDMAYSGGQIEEFTRRIEKILRKGIVPRAILLSGGGNDVAGKEFATLLNHKSSAIPGLNNAVVDGIINERIRLSYLTIISKVTAICKLRIGHPVPIILHGYDYPIPDGRGFLGGWWFLPGPWFEPGFREKGYAQIQERIDIVKNLINIFNSMLQEVSSRPEFNHVRYLDLRGTLSTSDNYRDDWANELHPTSDGFKRVTDKFAQVLDTFL
ncbi:MAG: hypothetical protein CTY18_07120 [Methylomonas sp.]|nr:MAG: hypothetical protein CTY24_15255 [Methylobacter sp.]PPD35264.1 MAG: hypothetical protein CTY18_07120 [Methylomonas sp.]